MMKHQLAFLYYVTLTCSFLLFTSAVWAKPVTPPQDPSQTITYWKPQVISAEHDENVALAQSVFDVLLRTWDTARVEPDLYIVNSTAGPWAASLADGNILLSRNAIDICLRFGKKRAEHLLAFILGHELAHQRAEDLWHQKFLRLAGSQAPEVQRKLLKDLKIDPDTITQLEQREAQADHDGLLIMASVGYDPFLIVDQKDFFTTWVENLWKVSCSSHTHDPAISSACNKAQSRALRTRAQLTTVATQNSLFELGMQQYVAANYERARHFFSAFGKNFPSRAVFSNIGLAYLQQAIDIEQRISQLDDSRISLIYPIMLSQSPLKPVAETVANNKRGASDIVIAQLVAKKHLLADSAISQFEKAIRLQPDHRNSYLLLAASYLVDDNTFMSRGILQGKYLPKFGKDTEAQLLLAITAHKEQKIEAARTGLRNALNEVSNLRHASLSEDSLRYALTYNLSAISKQLGNLQASQRLWNSLARQSKQNGNAYLFQLAVSNINRDALPNTKTPNDVKTGPVLGDKFKSDDNTMTINELWLDGDKYRVIRKENGGRLVADENNYLIAVSNLPTSGNGKSLNIGDPADRILINYGLPSRRVYVERGEYLAYDELALAVHIVNNRVTGWFSYRNHDTTM